MHAKPFSDSRVELLPGAIDAPEPKVMIDGLPRRKVVGQKTPGATAAEDVEDGVEDLAQGMDPRTSFGFRSGKMRLYAKSFGIGEVGLVCFSHAR